MAADSPVRSVARTLDLLDLFDHRRTFLPLSEIVERSGLPKTTVVRLLANLQARGLVSVRQDGRYAPGAGMLRWVRMSAALWEVNDQTRASMRRLVDAHGETVNVYVRQDEVRMSIAQEEGTHTVRTVVEVGHAMPLWGGSAAKVLLTAVPHLLDRLLARHPEVDADRLRGDVEAAARDGYSVSDGERELGATAVSAPVVGGDGRTVAALTMSGPTSRFHQGLEEHVRAVVDAAKEVSGFGLGSVEELL